jgi:hypothetical protein
MAENLSPGEWKIFLPGFLCYCCRKKPSLDTSEIGQSVEAGNFENCECL